MSEKKINEKKQKKKKKQVRNDLLGGNINKQRLIAYKCHKNSTIRKYGDARN